MMRSQKTHSTGAVGDTETPENSIAYISKINTVLMQRLNRALYDECSRNGFAFVDNGAVTENDLWVDGIHLQERRKCIIANNMINNFNHFLESANPLQWYLRRKVLYYPNLKLSGKIL